MSENHSSQFDLKMTYTAPLFVLFGVVTNEDASLFFNYIVTAIYRLFRVTLGLERRCLYQAYLKYQIPISPALYTQHTTDLLPILSQSAFFLYCRSFRAIATPRQTRSWSRFSGRVLLLSWVRQVAVEVKKPSIRHIPNRRQRRRYSIM